MRSAKALVERAFVWLRAIGERDTCVYFFVARHW